MESTVINLYQDKLGFLYINSDAEPLALQACTRVSNFITDAKDFDSEMENGLERWHLIQPSYTLIATYNLETEELVMVNQPCNLENRSDKVARKYLGLAE
jgi:hypothetical protein